MALRLLNGVQKYRQVGNQFRGYMHVPFGEAGSFYEMENMSGREYPLITSRRKRRKVRSFTALNALFGHDTLGWVDQGALYWDGEKVCDLTAGKKTVVEMGAYIVIFPDKMRLNTQTGEIDSLENETQPSGDVTYTTCELDGRSRDYRSATYLKVAATGVGAGFRENDVVEVRNSTVLEDGFYQLYTVTENSFVVLATAERTSQTQTDHEAVFSRKTPDMDYVTECDNRLWGCSNEKHEIYACALGDATNWRTYQGLANDSYAVTVGSPGVFTGAATHLGYVLFFKEDVILKIYGTKPSNYQLTAVHARGVEEGSAESITLMNETLYYKSPGGMVSFEGSLPEEIDESLGNVEYSHAVTGCRDGQLWVSMKDGDGHYNLFTYNGQSGYWYREDSVKAVAFRNIGKSLYMATEKALWLLEGPGNKYYEDAGAEDEEQVNWYAETGDLDMADLNKRHLQRAAVRLRLDADARCRVMAQYDGGEWHTLKQLRGKDDLDAVTVPLIPHRCDHMRLRVSGRGRAELMQLEYYVWSGSEL